MTETPDAAVETAPQSAAATQAPSPATAAPAGKRRATFHPLEVTELRRLTADSVEIAFAVPEELADDYDYAPGQYVALRAELDGAEVRRSYSICAVPTRGEIRVAVKKDLGGKFSTWANEELQVGQRIDVMNPQGAFTSRTHVTSLNDAQAVAAAEVAKKPNTHLVAFAAGSGITPIMAIAQAVLTASETSRFDLVYANRSAMDVMFAEELGDLKDRHPARFTVHHVLSREQRVAPLLSGRIDAEKLTTLLDRLIDVKGTDEWFLCGPFELVQLARDTLAARGVPEQDIRFELFTTGKPDAPAGQSGRAVQADPSGENVTVEFVLDGLSSTVESPASAHETLLNAALRVRSDVPFACAGGVCGTCRAKVTDGTVEMGENYALEKDEVEAGYVLTCQTRPTSERVGLDFDS